jgi:hypothetical protein
MHRVLPLHVLFLFLLLLLLLLQHHRHRHPYHHGSSEASFTQKNSELLQYTSLGQIERDDKIDVAISTEFSTNVWNFLVNPLFHAEREISCHGFEGQ